MRIYQVNDQEPLEPEKVAQRTAKKRKGRECGKPATEVLPVQEEAEPEDTPCSEISDATSESDRRNNAPAAPRAEIDTPPAAQLGDRRKRLEKGRAALLMEAGNIATTQLSFANTVRQDFQRKRCWTTKDNAMPAQTQVLPGSIHRSPAEMKNDAPQPDRRRRNDARSRLQVRNRRTSYLFRYTLARKCYFNATQILFNANSVLPVYKRI
ncbi:hypothetical protein NDU88_002079 [Pleurodeles waltl]|uniref:Uncharacterized protein n=1 Tax=Pleurodeles waltl TaxID=8319 RepID=A0AAV7RC97_PLEWA|nr:hypothetical protein NDU88_002079 [Pleurodeles waltl]